VKEIFWRISLVIITVLLMSLIVAALSGEANALNRRPRHVQKMNLFMNREHPKRLNPRAFPPSKAALLAQNAAIDALGLHRFKDDADVQAAIQAGDIIPIQDSRALKIVAPTNRYLRPEAARELAVLSAAFYNQFHRSLLLTSALRTEQYQFRLRRWNHNAAPVRGPYASSHLAGTTFDIGRKRFTRAENRWMELYLTSQGSALIVEEERVQACFHIFVRG
jgi:hypothetical protein